MIDQSTWDEAYRKGLTPWRDTTPDLAPLLKTQEIQSGLALDLGCGTGETAIWLAEHGFEVEALDVSDEALRIAREQSSKPIFVSWDLNHLAEYKFLHEKYDVVVDNKVIAFIEHKEQYLDTIAAHLSGILILQVFLDHPEKPEITIKETYLDNILSARFEIVLKKISKRNGIVSADYVVKIK